MKRCYENGVVGDGVTESRKLCMELRQRTAYMPKLHALPWAFGQNWTRQMQELTLQHHAEKKALAVLLARGETHLNVYINFNACMDCHEFFKSSSRLLGRRIQ